MQRRDVISEEQSEEDLTHLDELAVKMGALEAKITDVKNIIAEDWVRLKCQYGCGNYRKALTCPPYSPTPEQMRRTLKGYPHAILMRLPDESVAAHDVVAKLETCFPRGLLFRVGIPGWTL